MWEKHSEFQGFTLLEEKSGTCSYLSKSVAVIGTDQQYAALGN